MFAVNCNTDGLIAVKTDSHNAKASRPLTVSPYAVALCALTLIGITAMILIYLGICAQNIKSQYHLCRLKETKSTLERTRLALRLEVNRLNSLERIETIAKKELGMSHPPNRFVIDMRNPSVLQASLEDVVAVESNRKTDSD